MKKWSWGWFFSQPHLQILKLQSCQVIMQSDTPTSSLNLGHIQNESSEVTSGRMRNTVVLIHMNEGDLSSTHVFFFYVLGGETRSNRLSTDCPINIQNTTKRQKEPFHKWSKWYIFLLILILSDAFNDLSCYCTSCAIFVSDFWSI